MKELNGVPVSQGILIGKAVVIKRQELDCPRHFIHAKSTGREIKRLEKAISKSKNQLTRHIRGLRHDEYGFFEVLNAHLLMMDDVEFLDRIKAIISERLQNAEWALQQVSRELILAMGEATDPYLRARAEDIQHVSNRVMANLCGIKADPDAGKLRGAVVVAHAISPGNLARMVKQGLAGMAVDVGGETSHAAIIARALGIPAVVGMGNASTSVKDGDKVILDGLRGKLVMEPTEQQIEEYKEVRQRFMAFEDELLSLTLSFRRKQKTVLSPASVVISKPKTNLTSCCPTVQRALPWCVPSFCIWAARRSPTRKPSIRPTAVLSSVLASGWLPSGPLIWAARNFLPICPSLRKKTRLWGCGPYGTA